ncbi:pantoate--beta-alanine ligase [Glaciibacter psychrotolerans]|uniref:Pantothenate synthetase n=1 Tax=Glaciibacter psychrotolerans TaxID=670054 RepID=A0A7Z0EH56_9MICO|nr:pantoate--beta-alanine ligase [Leifsonia psychrotolerans]NYJ21436.1 pantoate--beta-alanine ligase [Leifsonia psychrotolerans]
MTQPPAYAPTSVPVVIARIDELRERLTQAKATLAADGRTPRVVLVPTMGALHDGHLSLVERARELGDIVVVSIFVNPLQFGSGEDLDSYPRTLHTDVAALATLQVPFVFAPTPAEMYPNGASATRVTAGDVSALYEGAARPGHFDGMLTVVAKLFNIVGCDVAVFGQKDAQQVFLISQMVADLNLPVVVEVVPIVREHTGLALSSRNQFLSAAERDAAGSISAGLRAASGRSFAEVSEAVAAARGTIEAQSLVKLEYLVVVHPQTFLPVEPDYRGPARMLVAAIVGTTRLIDNVPLDLS